MAQVIDHNGKLTVTFGWWPNKDEPVEERTIHVSPINASEFPLLIGRKVEDWRGNVGWVWEPQFSRKYSFDTTDWRTVHESRPVKKPRRGRQQGLTYDWEWLNGRWVKKWV